MSDNYIEGQKINARLRRNGLLAKSDIAVLRAYETSTPVSQAWVTYRQALRDITTNSGFPENITWPTQPE